MTSYWGHQDNPYPPRERSHPRCPVCGEDCETIYFIPVKFGTQIIGCDMCYNPDEWKDEDVQEDDPWEDVRCMEEDHE